MVVVIMLPIVILVFGSLKTRGEMYSRPYTIPNPPRWENYIKILSSGSFWTMLRNSLVVMVAVTVGVVFICALAAFVFSRMEFRGKGAAFNLLTLGVMFPLNVAILPIYLVLRQMHLLNNLSGVILVHIAFQLSANILILRGFFAAVPARTAGCFVHRWLWRIWLLLAHPASVDAPGAGCGRRVDHDLQLERFARAPGRDRQG